MSSKLSFVPPYNPISEFFESSGQFEQVSVTRNFSVLWSPELKPFTRMIGSNFGEDAYIMSCYKFLEGESLVIRGTVYFSERCEGPPSIVHGGCVCTILDMISGLFLFVTKGIPVDSDGWGMFTKNLNVSFRSFTPLRSNLLVECRMTPSSSNQQSSSNHQQDPTISNGKIIYSVQARISRRLEADIEDVDHHIPFTRSMDELRSGEWLSNSKLCAESEAIFSSRGHSFSYELARTMIGDKSGLSPGEIAEKAREFQEEMNSRSSSKKNKKKKRDMKRDGNIRSNL